MRGPPQDSAAQGCRSIEAGHWYRADNWTSFVNAIAPHGFVRQAWAISMALRPPEDIHCALFWRGLLPKRFFLGRRQGDLLAMHRGQVTGARRGLRQNARWQA